MHFAKKTEKLPISEWKAAQYRGESYARRGRSSRVAWPAPYAGGSNVCKHPKPTRASCGAPGEEKTGQRPQTCCHFEAAYRRTRTWVFVHGKQVSQKSGIGVCVVTRSTEIHSVILSYRCFCHHCAGDSSSRFASAQGRKLRGSISGSRGYKT